MSGFIDALPISGLDKLKLKQLGTDTPFGLLSLIQAAPNEFDSLMGFSADLIRKKVEELVPPARRNLIGTTTEFPLGAHIKSLPRAQQPTIDVGLRDQLFEEWENLLTNPATRDGPRAKELEEQLNALLEREYSSAS